MRGEQVLNKQEEKTVKMILPRGILDEMEAKSRKVLEEYIEKFGKIRFFSYGSNLNESDYVKRIKTKANILQINLTDEEARLLNKKPGLLKGYKRSLKNHSITHGAAYTIHKNEVRSTEGICHDITIKALRPFLLKEALITNEKKYFIKELEIKVNGENSAVLTLIGKRENSVALSKLTASELQNALRYVKDLCIEGSKELHIKHEDMEGTRNYIERLLNKNRRIILGE